MRRKALLVSMAMMTSLPGGVLAKGTGKHDRIAHPYTGAWGSEYSLDLGQETTGAAGADVTGAQGVRVTTLFSRIGNLLIGLDNAPVEERPLVTKGWSMELTNPAGTPVVATGLQPAKGLNLGLAFRYTF